MKRMNDRTVDIQNMSSRKTPGADLQLIVCSIEVAAKLLTAWLPIFMHYSYASSASIYLAAAIHPLSTPLTTAHIVQKYFIKPLDK